MKGNETGVDGSGSRGNMGMAWGTETQMGQGGGGRETSNCDWDGKKNPMLSDVISLLFLVTIINSGS